VKRPVRPELRVAEIRFETPQEEVRRSMWRRRHPRRRAVSTAPRKIRAKRSVAD